MRCYHYRYAFDCFIATTAHDAIRDHARRIGCLPRSRRRHSTLYHFSHDAPEFTYQHCLRERAQPFIAGQPAIALMLIWPRRRRHRHQFTYRAASYSRRMYFYVEILISSFS